MRQLIAQIDGDGCWNLDWIRRVKALLEKHPRIKFDVSTIVSYLDGSVRPRDAMTRVKLFREIFSLPNVEPCNHSFSHPTNWRDRNSGGTTGKPWNLEKEVCYSTDFIDSQLVPEGTKCEVFLLTGACNPDVEALKAMHERGLIVMNGGIDWEKPYKDVGGYRRYGQRAWHDCWHTGVRKYKEGVAYVEHPDGYRKVIEYFKEHVERPVHVYFHFYCAEFPETYQSVDYVLNWVNKQPLESLFLTEYVKQLHSKNTYKE
jgi:hypothetical protein